MMKTALLPLICSAWFGFASSAPAAPGGKALAIPMQACADYLRTQNPWASEHRTPEILEVLQSYGAQAQRIVPHLRETAALFDKGEKDFPKSLSERKAKAVREAIEKIETAQERPDLKRLK